MIPSFRISDTSHEVSILEIESVSAQGVLNPILTVSGRLSLSPHIEDAHLELSLRLDFGDEMLGESRVERMHVAEHSQPGILFEIPISQRLLAYITDRLSSDQKDIIMQARFRGHGEYSLQGVKKEFELSYHPFSLTTPRSEWYAQVLSQTRRGQYRFMEIKLPVSDDDLAKEWAASVEHLKSAEKAYVDCDDSEVFHYLRAALDALPGAKKDICDGISDSKKSEAINDILLKVGAYLHSGRHVSSKSNNPDEVGSFPVNRIDAAFAIDLVRTVLSHLSLMMSTDKGRL